MHDWFAYIYCTLCTIDNDEDIACLYFVVFTVLDTCLMASFPGQPE